MNASVLYMVRFWVDPAGAAQVFEWLDGSHCAEVASQPGFVFFHRVHLEQQASDGWESHVVVYGVTSREALEKYFGDRELSARFAREAEPLKSFLRVERTWGAVEASFEIANRG
jgi:hypothetical protein